MDTAVFPAGSVGDGATIALDANQSVAVLLDQSGVSFQIGSADDVSEARVLSVGDYVRSGEANVLVGTQMIAKGLDFPNVSLVGVVAADLSLNLPDFRSVERTFQLITQVAGRAGRADVPGRVVVQTYDPDHYGIRLAAAQDYRAFYMREEQARRRGHRNYMRRPGHACRRLRRW
jgi:primosomal protein N'